MYTCMKNKIITSKSLFSFVSSNMVFKIDLMLLIICIMCYGHTLKGNFVFDDTEAIVNNKDLNSNNSAYNILLNDFWGTSIRSNASHKSYRPISVFVYRCIVQLLGYKEPLLFHMLNIILYFMICQQWYRYLQILADDNIAFYSTVLFAVHPIHTEVIASIVGCADLLSSLFFLFGLKTFHKAIVHNSTKRYIASLCFISIATFCKETGITSAGTCLLIDILLSTMTFKKMPNKLFYVRSLGLISMIITLLYTRYKVMDFTVPAFQPQDNPASFAPNVLTRFLSYSYIYALNEVLLLWPHWLCFDWSMGCIPLVQSFDDARIMIVLIFWMAAIYYFYQTLFMKNPILSFALALIAITFLPASNLLFRVGFVIAERILFLPSAGHCLLVIYGWQKLYNYYPKYRFILQYLFWFLIIIFGLKTHIRAMAWLNENDLFTSALDVCPSNAKVHYNIGKVAADRGNFTYAEKEYNVALQLYPEYDQAMNNLANILRDRGKLVEAKDLLEKAVSLRMDFAAAWMNLGIVLATLGDDNYSEISYKEAIKHRKNYSDCYYNLGNLYLKQKRYTEALSCWRTATDMNPSHSSAWSNMLVLLDTLDQHERVIQISKEALNNCPLMPAIHFTTANTYGKLERWKEAEKHFQIAISLNSKNPLYYSNFGVLYHRWGILDKAKEMYKLAIELNPEMAIAKKNLQRIS